MKTDYDSIGRGFCVRFNIRELPANDQREIVRNVLWDYGVLDAINTHPDWKNIIATINTAIESALTK